MTTDELLKKLDAEHAALTAKLPPFFESYGRYVYWYKDISSYQNDKYEIGKILDRQEQILNRKQIIQEEARD